MVNDKKYSILDDWMTMYEEIQIYVSSDCLPTMNPTDKALQGIEESFRKGKELSEAQEKTLLRLKKQIEHRREELDECLKAQGIFLKRYPPYQWVKLTSKQKNRYLSFLAELKWRDSEGTFVFDMRNRITEDRMVSSRMISTLEDMIAERSAQKETNKIHDA